MRVIADPPVTAITRIPFVPLNSSELDTSLERSDLLDSNCEVDVDVS